MLQQYKMSFLDKLNFAVAVRDYTGPDDQSAIDHARTLSLTHMIEIVQLDRMVARIPKDKKPAVIRAQVGANKG
jgi:hypothetical protein